MTFASNTLNGGYQKGFIAFLSILIISVLLLGMTLSLAQFGISMRFGLLGLEEKHMSETLGEACIHYAEILIVNDPTYTLDTPQELPVGETTCTLVSVERTGPTHTVRAQASVGDAITNLEATFTSRTGTLLFWKEVLIF